MGHTKYGVSVDTVFLGPHSDYEPVRMRHNELTVGQIYFDSTGGAGDRFMRGTKEGSVDWNWSKGLMVIVPDPEAIVYGLHLKSTVCRG